MILLKLKSDHLPPLIETIWWLPGVRKSAVPTVAIRSRSPWPRVPHFVTPLLAHSAVVEQPPSLFLDHGKHLPSLHFFSLSGTGFSPGRPHAPSLTSALYSNITLSKSLVLTTHKIAPLPHHHSLSRIAYLLFYHPQPPYIYFFILGSHYRDFVHCYINPVVKALLSMWEIFNIHFWMNKETLTYVPDSVLNLLHTLSYWILVANNKSMLLQPFNPQELLSQSHTDSKNTKMCGSNP